MPAPLQAVRGMNDVLPDEAPLWELLEDAVRDVFRQYGYRNLRVPLVEPTPLFVRAIGEVTDVVEREMYTFEDKLNGESLTLRPEATSGIVRATLQHNLTYDRPQRVWTMGPMFRHERPQKGRYRQFYQIGVEALGTDHPHVDVEVLAMLHALFARLGITGLTLQVNSLGDGACRGAYREALKTYLAGKLPALCADCKRRYETNPLRVLDCKVDADKFTDSPVMLDHLCGPCKAHFDTVERGLEKLGIPFEVNPRLVRGLDYYTRTTFELVMGHLGAQNTVAAGGRYDGLVEEIGGPPTPGIGFALGVERAISLLDTKELRAPRPALFIAALGPEAASFAFPLIHGLKSSGVRAETEYAGGSLKSQMKKADRSGARYTLIIGEQEMKEGKAVLRNMQTKEQVPVALAGILEELKAKLS
ncbi:MAG: histidine--tRNA ligase [Acidobacteriota bacterium]